MENIIYIDANAYKQILIKELDKYITKDTYTHGKLVGIRTCIYLIR